MSLVLWVGLGGFVGAISRYGVMSLISSPVGTIVVNIIGSFLLGALLEVSALKWSFSPEIRAFIVVGILGAFTTFSTFSMDTVYLLERQEFKAAAFYTLTSVGFSILAFMLAIWIFRQILG